jgi:uncharacterized protein (TIGR03437 family)
MMDVQLGKGVFQYYQGFPLTPTTTTMTVTNAGNADLNWTISAPVTTGGNWLQVSANSGTTPANGYQSKVVVTVNPMGVAMGTFTSTFNVTAAPNLSTPIIITLNISPPTVVTVSGNGNLGIVFPEDNPAIPIALQVQQWNGTALVPAHSVWNAKASAPWILLYPITGNADTSASIAISKAGLDYGTYSGQVTFSSPDGSFPTIILYISFLYRDHGACSAPSSISAQLTQGKNQVCQPITFYSRLDDINYPTQYGLTVPPLPWEPFTIIGIDNGPWFSVNLPTSGYPHAYQTIPLQACFDATILSPGVHKATATWVLYEDSPLVLNAQLTVVPAPVIKVSPTTVSFTTVNGTDPAPQVVTVTNTGGATLNWTSTTTANPWWTYSPNTGSNNSTAFTVQPHAATLSPGSYSGSIFLTDPNALNATSAAPLEIKMTLTVLPQAVMALDKPSIAFMAAHGTNPGSQTFQVQNTGTGAMGWSAAVATTSGGSWLTVSPATGVAPSLLTLTPTSAGLAAGTYKATVTITALASANATNSPQTLPVTLVVGTPTATAAGFVNGASFAAGSVTPGSIVSVFGVDLSAGTATSSGDTLPLILVGTQVLVNGGPVPLFYVSPGQVNFQMPMEAAGTVAVTVTSGAITGAPVMLPLLPVSPGIFLGTGTQAAALNADYSANSPANPVPPGGVIQLYVTGLGITNPPLPTGQPGALTPPLNQTVVTPTATISGAAAQVLFSGVAPGFVGLYQVNVTIPAGIQTGDAVPVVLSAGGQNSNSATIAVH